MKPPALELAAAERAAQRVEPAGERLDLRRVQLVRPAGEPLPDAAVALVLGVISVAFALRRFLAARYAPAPTRTTPPNRPAGLFWGAVAGFTSMIAHAGGPPFQIYVLPQHLPRDTFVGTGVVFFALVNLVKVPPYLALGQLTPESLLTSVALFPLAIASTWAGVWLVRRVGASPE